MKYLVIPVVVVLAIVCAVTGYSADDVDWRVKKADQAKYVELRAEAKKAYDSKKYVKAAGLYEALAETGHCARFSSVKACQYNNAADALIQGNRDEEGLITSKVAKECMRLLTLARLYSLARCGEVVDSNISYCEARIELKDGDK